ncbi:hypothetical protein [Limnochorda pilosa]|uniref:Uncharacterized protein n=1 Tax=Limnochorda pilosa TaxID=1555112 RepID=A0A0K2SNW6_LIMPI|nr:hypothetical protein [Limnochorda pilosa]BAS28682.1 hypothetical protein LIP_2853 [Limnochorda pilosa]
MSRKLAFFLTGVLFLALAAGASAQYNPNGEALPPGAQEQEVFWFNGDTQAWESIGSGGAAQLARSWNSGPTFGNCNKAYWDITFTSHASVAQWLDWTLQTTRKDWRIRKPGQYASDSIDFSIASNNAVLVSFDGFDDLQYLNPDAPEDTTNYIETYYGVGNSFDAANANGWVRAADLNEATYTFPNTDDLHHGMQFKFWQKINVVESNSSSEYENVGTVRLALTNLKYWIDGQTGGYLPNQTGLGQPPTEPYVPPTI